MVNPRDILGMNARNLLYIRPNNLRKAIRIADSKLKTKQVLDQVKIPNPKLQGMFKNFSDLEDFDWENLPANVVLKPNRGFGGEGIVVFSKKETINGETFFITSSGRKWSIGDIKRHILNILDGNYSLQNIPDVAFFEEKIITHRNFRKYTYKGLPDVRVIVYNNVPVMAMMRLPTKWSKGKGNLMQGAIGAAIDMATGRTTKAAAKKPVRKMITIHPDTKQDLKGLSVPYWKEVLEMSIKCQQTSGVGFLGADIAIDEKRGPLVLELNARPGLEIQNVNMSPLASRLKRVEGLKVDSTDKGVRLAKELFGGGSEKKLDELVKKPVIGAEETIEIITPDGKRRRILARIDSGAGLSSIDKKLCEKINLPYLEKNIGVRSALGKQKRNMVEVTFVLAGEKITTKATISDRANMKYQAIIGRRDLQNFLIDAGKKEVVTSQKFDYKKVDSVLADVNRKISIMSYLKPTNLTKERDSFFAKKDYSPQFEYDIPPASELDLLATRVSRFNLEKDKSTLGKILYKKQQTIIKAIDLIKSIGSPEFTKNSIALYGEPNDENLDYAKQNLKQNKPKTKEDEFLPIKKTLKILKAKLDTVSIPYKIVIINDLPVKIKITNTSKTLLINIRDGMNIKKNSLLKFIAREIESRAYRYANGLLQPYKIFSSGFADYLPTEKGIAIYREKEIPATRKYSTMALKYITIANSLAGSFRETYNGLRDKGVLPKTAFNLTYKAKRGLADTSRPGGLTRGIINLDGYLQVKDYIEKGFDMKKLYVGKIGIEDLPRIQKVSNIKPPKYLPDK